MVSATGWLQHRAPRVPAARLERACVAVILVGLAAALVAQAWMTGVPIDSPSHVLSSYLYWHGADRLEPRDMPPLIKLAAGWVPALIGLPVVLMTVWF